jgi:hypothetical protein
MNRRQAKKKLYKEHGIITPRQASPRLTKKFTFSLIDLVQKRLAEHIDNLIINGERGE